MNKPDANNWKIKMFDECMSYFIMMLLAVICSFVDPYHARPYIVALVLMMGFFYLVRRYAEKKVQEKEEREKSQK
jgi:Flp pilus assembly protein TadB